MEEIWKDIYFKENDIIYDYRGIYKISNLGQIKSLERLDNKGRIIYERMLSIKKCKDGYCRVGLSLNGKVKHFLVHRLVAYMFIPNPNNLSQVNHINEFEKDNNCVDNLEWCTCEYNCNYGTRNERTSKNNTGKTKNFTEEQLKQKSENMKGKNNYFYDVHMFGEDNPFYGKHHTEESKRKMKESRKNVDMERIKSIIRDTNSIKVVQLDLDNNIVNIWNSIKDASDNLEITSSPIVRCCKGNQNKSKGYKWKYLSDVSDDDLIKYLTKLIINHY